MVLLCDMDRLLVLVNPTGLPVMMLVQSDCKINTFFAICVWFSTCVFIPGVALQDGEHDDIESGVGRVQHLLAGVHAQGRHFLNRKSI